MISVYGPSDLFESTSSVSSGRGEERTAVEDEDGERGTERQQRDDSFI